MADWQVDVGESVKQPVGFSGKQSLDEDFPGALAGRLAVGADFVALQHPVAHNQFAAGSALGLMARGRHGNFRLVDHDKRITGIALVECMVNGGVRGLAPDVRVAVAAASAVTCAVKRPAHQRLSQPDVGGAVEQGRINAEAPHEFMERQVRAVPVFHGDRIDAHDAAHHAQVAAALLQDFARAIHKLERGPAAPGAEGGLVARIGQVGRAPREPAGAGVVERQFNAGIAHERGEGVIVVNVQGFRKSVAALVRIKQVGRPDHQVHPVEIRHVEDIGQFADQAVKLCLHQRMHPVYAFALGTHRRELFAPGIDGPDSVGALRHLGVIGEGGDIVKFHQLHRSAELDAVRVEGPRHDPFQAWHNPRRRQIEVAHHPGIHPVILPDADHVRILAGELQILGVLVRRSLHPDQVLDKAAQRRPVFVLLLFRGQGARRIHAEIQTVPGIVIATLVQRAEHPAGSGCD